jgi:inner membrane protein
MQSSPMVRLAIMGFLMAVLLVPLSMMYLIVAEREGRRDQVAHEISVEAGGPQRLAGPVLVVPYRYSTTDNAGRTTVAVAQACFLPESLDVSGRIDPEIRRRSLFPVVTYRSHFRVQGQFKPVVLTHLRRAPEQVLWDDATVAFGVSDPRGIARQLALTLGGQQRPFMPGISDVGLFATGVHADAAGMASSTTPLQFAFDVDLNGTREINFLPAGDNTTVKIESSWPHPSFAGAPLPEERRVEAGGFTATWRVPYFGRGYPSVWTTDAQAGSSLQLQAATSVFGVGLIQPVDIYQQTERAVKYAVLFIVTTYVIAFVWEITGGVVGHPVQYLFVGFALCLFYMLLLSLSEHIGFDAAYAAAAAATTALLGWYWTWVMRGAHRRWLMAAALAGLYSYLYLLLRLEEYALLAGSVGLFTMLALVMFLTRRIDWYTLRLKTPA